MHRQRKSNKKKGDFFSNAPLKKRSYTLWCCVTQIAILRHGAGFHTYPGLDLADSLYDFGSTIVRLELLSTAFKRRHHVFGFSALNAFGEGVLFGVPDEYPEQRRCCVTQIATELHGAAIIPMRNLMGQGTIANCV